MNKLNALSVLRGHCRNHAQSIAAAGADSFQIRLDSGAAAAAFSMYPVSMDALLDIADLGRSMAPKSTWFEPKLRSGLFLHRF